MGLGLAVGLPWVGGCLAAKPEPSLGRVGPVPGVRVNGTEDGDLVVYTVRDPLPRYGELPMREVLSGYTILGQRGDVIRRVPRNSPETAVDGPIAVRLAPGDYVVRAEALGYGEVSVPIRIEARRRTVVRLDEGEAVEAGSRPPVGQIVCLPDGRMVGWKAAGGSESLVAGRGSTR